MKGVSSAVCAAVGAVMGLVVFITILMASQLESKLNVENAESVYIVTIHTLEEARMFLTRAQEYGLVSGILKLSQAGGMYLNPPEIPETDPVELSPEENGVLVWNWCDADASCSSNDPCKNNFASEDIDIEYFVNESLAQCVSDGFRAYATAFAGAKKDNAVTVETSNETSSLGDTSVSYSAEINTIVHTPYSAENSAAFKLKGIVNATDDVSSSQNVRLKTIVNELKVNMDAFASDMAGKVESKSDCSAGSCTMDFDLASEFTYLNEFAHLYVGATKKSHIDCSDCSGSGNEYDIWYSINTITDEDSKLKVTSGGAIEEAYLNFTFVTQFIANKKSC